MCNLYRLASSRTEVADFFDAVAADFSGNAPAETYPGYPGLVASESTLSQMVWGFPFARTGAKGQALKPKPVNNARTDKLKSFFWRDSFENRRCLIPLNAFAEAEGAKGQMTRTWFSLPDSPIFATAGLWRETDEWGASYSMIMTDANDQVSPVHNRMPVILPKPSWDTWLEGTPHQAFDLCQPYGGAMTVERTDELWFKKRGS